MTVLEFEKPIYEIQKKIDEFKKMSLESGMDFNGEIEGLEKQANEIKKELYETLKPSQKLQIASHRLADRQRAQLREGRILFRGGQRRLPRLAQG